MSVKLVILDRDGVINYDSDNYIKTVDEWLPIEGSLEAIAKLKNNDYKVAIATNQSGIGRGFYSIETMHQMHQKMADLLKPLNASIDHIEFCPHHPDDNCSCRKPKPGMLHNIQKVFNANLSHTYFVGDTLSDLATADHAKTRFALVKTGKGERILNRVLASEAHKNTPVFNHLAHFVDVFIEKGGTLV